MPLSEARSSSKTPSSFPAFAEQGKLATRATPNSRSSRGRGTAAACSVSTMVLAVLAIRDASCHSRVDTRMVRSVHTWRHQATLVGCVESARGRNGEYPEAGCQRQRHVHTCKTVGVSTASVELLLRANADHAEKAREDVESDRRGLGSGKRCHRTRHPKQRRGRAPEVGIACLRARPGRDRRQRGRQRDDHPADKACSDHVPLRRGGGSEEGKPVRDDRSHHEGHVPEKPPARGLVPASREEEKAHARAAAWLRILCRVISASAEQGFELRTPNS